MKIIEKEKCLVTVRRQDGTIEEYVHPKISYMTVSAWEAFKKAMKAKGFTAISYKNVEAVVELEEADYLTYCVRCGKKLDTRTAYSQREGRFLSYYCVKCVTLLSSIGRGELSAMEERRRV